MRDTEPRPTHRENSPDALLGTLLDVDALRRPGITTRYSTREQDIRDGIEDAVTAILGYAQTPATPL
jgi:hypothetical protein